MLTAIGDIDIDLSQVYAVTDVQDNPADPEAGIEASYSFEIALHGGSLGLVGDSEEDAEEARQDVIDGLDPATLESTGGVTFDYSRVTALGPVGSDDEGTLGFEVYFVGSEATLIYDSESEAENARNDLLNAING